MSRHVSALDVVVKDVRTDLEQVVDRPPHNLLVARDGTRADDDRVAGLDLHPAMVAVRHPRETGHGLALGAGRGDNELVVRDLLDPVLRDELIRWVLQIAELARDTDVLLHRAPNDGDLAIEGPCRVEDLLDARDV